MSIKFNNVRTYYGLDDVLVFPRHYGKTVRQILIDDPSYINWIMKNTENYFSDSVHNELDKALLHKAKFYSKPKLSIYDSMNYHDFDDWFDDIPF